MRATKKRVNATPVLPESPLLPESPVITPTLTEAPVVAIFVRHSADCKYRDDETWKRCDCRKHFRWTRNGKQFRRKAGTRSWSEAEKLKRALEDQLAGREPKAEDRVQDLQSAIDGFMKVRKLSGTSEAGCAVYKTLLDRLLKHAQASGIFTVQRLTAELLTDFMSTWTEFYKSTWTQSVQRKYLKSFLRFCYQSQWLVRLPVLPLIKVTEPETLPLTDEEYARLLSAIPEKWEDEHKRKEVRALVRLMRHSGLAIRDAIMLRKDELRYDKEKNLYRVLIARQKTGTHVSVPLPPDVAAELLALPKNGNRPDYFFWRTNLAEKNLSTFWAHNIVTPLFEAAKIVSDGNLKSHRLRDTYAVDLLQKGVPLEDVSKALGHTSIRTTERHYAKWVKSRQDRLDSLIVATWT